MHERNLDELVSRITMSLRSKYTDADPTQPRFFEADQYQLGEHLYKRLRIILRSNGCSVPTCTMCPFPNEALDPSIQHISAEQYIQQIKHVLSANSSCDILSIYNDGSFFAERELPRQARQKIYQISKDYGCQYLMVESLPFFITQEKLEDAKQHLGDKTKLVVGIGLQSASDIARHVCIRAPVTKESFLQAHHLLSKFDFETKAYIIFKPPFFLEAEAIHDAVNSAAWLAQQGVQDITLCPMRIAPGTILQDLLDRQLYALPSLASFIECLDQIQQKGICVRISIFNMSSSDLDALTPSGCAQCEGRILRGLEDHNNLMMVDFSKLKCPSCLKKGMGSDPVAFNGLPFEDRVKLWARLHEGTTAPEKLQGSQLNSEPKSMQDKLVSNVHAWDVFAEAHTTSTFPIQQLQLDKTFKHTDRLLDYGCGEGRIIKFLTMNGFTHITGCDPSTRMCEYARRNNPLSDIVWLRNPRSFDLLNNAFDGILLIAVLSSVIPERERLGLIKRIRRSLVKGGKIVIGDFGASQQPLYLNRYAAASIEPKTFETEDGILIHHFAEGELWNLLEKSGAFRVGEIRAIEAVSVHGRPLSAFVAKATAI